MTVFGQGFTSGRGDTLHSDVECVFGTRAVPADVVSSVEVRCVTPHVPDAHVALLRVRVASGRDGVSSDVTGDTTSGHTTEPVSFVFFDARSHVLNPKP